MSPSFVNYKSAINWLFEQLPQYQRQGGSAYKPGLERTQKLMAHLGHPEQKIKSIHIAGTNGKGSTAHMLASVLQSAGYRVGLYTSPHLLDFRERIRLNGQMISESDVFDFLNTHAPVFLSMGLSFFEMTVGMAFDYFARQSPDVVIVETGMGGRLDSTNVITPVLSIITNIGMDHTQFLGNTLTDIAREKAGIIKTEVPVVVGQYTEETLPVFKTVSTDQSAPLILAQELTYFDLESDLKGGYQKDNKRTVLVAIDQLIAIGFSVAQHHIEHGLKHVQNQTGLLGRWQILAREPLLICDTAHNVDGLAMTMQQLLTLPAKQLHLVLGFVSDKALEDILKLMPKSGIYYYCAPDNLRAMPVAHLSQKAQSVGLKGEAYQSVQEALDEALNQAESEDVIYVGGSTFVVAEVL
jgi:dihydrofolate synthase/folylpolyglutamate synthase